MKKRMAVATLALIMASATAAMAAGAEDAPATKPAQDSVKKQAAQLAAAAPCMVIVEYTLQYDKGDEPQGRYRFDDLVKDERPLEMPGILVDATHVVTEDVQIHPRFIKSISVRRGVGGAKGAPRVAATISGYPKDRDFQMLELNGKLEGSAPAEFDAKRPGPFSLVVPLQVDGEWGAKVQGFNEGLLTERGKDEIAPDTSGLVVDAKGQAVSMVGHDEALPSDGAWKGSPLDWPTVSAADMQKSLAGLEDRAAHGIVRVMLNFRSPKNAPTDQYGAQPGNATVQYALGVLIDDSTLLVLAELKPTVTARLERIKILSSPPMEAKFKASLTDYGAFTATLDKPATGMAMPLSSIPIDSLSGASLPTVQVILQGDKRVSYVQPRRIAGLNVGWRRNLYPAFAGDSQGLFLCDPAGALLALPITHRQKVSTRDQYDNGPQPIVTSFAQVAAALKDLKNGYNPGNVPLTEAQENRLAWIGFDMQPMNPDLAQANNVSDQTDNGQTGALVTYVYPDSPAGKAGVEAGWVLLRLDAPGQPKPIDVRVQVEPAAEHPFPWDRLDGASEVYFDQIFQYSPWPLAENAVTRAITDLGFGKKFTAEFFHDGKVDKKQFTVVEGPPHFDNAPKYKCAPIGLTVKDLTYEVRRYMQKKPDDPGVIVGGIEVGSKASKAGIKPYEVITHVNEQPVMNVKDFERLTKGQTELRLSVKRMTHGRIVKITLNDAAASQPATQNAGEADKAMPQ